MPITGPDWLANPARLIDHTLLRATTTPEEIDRLCEEAVEAGFAAVCIPPNLVRRAAGRLYGSEVSVATVIGFPLGYDTPAVKRFAAAEAVAAGATEIDLVIDQGLAASGDLDAVVAEVGPLLEAVDGVPLKVIIECCHLSDTDKVALTRALAASGVAMVKTSTGMASGGATLEDVRLLSDAAGGRIGVKAAGGIRDWDFCRRLLEAGATRIGTSAGLMILQQWRQQQADV